MIKKKLILSQPLLDFTLERLGQELIENHGDLTDTILIGLQPRGTEVAERLVALLERQLGKGVKYGALDTTFHRDDFRRRDSPLRPNSTQMSYLVEDLNVILVDDVLATGRTVRAALDALQAFGRPLKVELLCLIDRSYNRDLPIQPDYIGKRVNTLDTQKVLVEWKDGQDKIWLIT